VDDAFLGGAHVQHNKMCVDVPLAYSTEKSRQHNKGISFRRENKGGGGGVECHEPDPWPFDPTSVKQTSQVHVNNAFSSWGLQCSRSQKAKNCKIQQLTATPFVPQEQQPQQPTTDDPVKSA
jgi:hypothetical protein